MDASYKGKLLAFAVSSALLLSSLVFLTGVQAGPAEDLGIENVSETLGSPPPRKNVAYDLDITWENEGLQEVGRDQNGIIRVKINEKYYRPCEVEFLLGDCSKAEKQLGWKRNYDTLDKLIVSMFEDN